MSVLSTKTKARVSAKTAKQAAKHPKLALRGTRGTKPVVGTAVNLRARQARDQATAVLDAARSIGQSVFDAGRQAAQDAAKAQAPRKRTAPWVVVGIGVGAGAMYLLDPASGDKRRHAVIGLITSNGGSGDYNTEPDVDDEAGGPAHPAPGHMPPEQR